jgi:tetratricopeptide (TPR) repeat protein
MDHRRWRQTRLAVVLGELSMAAVARGQTTTSPTQNQRFPVMDRPIFLSGQVMLEDGTPPPEQVLVQRACEGRVVPQGYTDSRGHFSFELGRNPQVALDAQNPMAADSFGFPGASRFPGLARPADGTDAGLNQRDLTGCELRVQLPGFYPAARDLSGRRILDSPDVGTLVLRRLPGVEGSVFSPTILQARKDARAAFEKGRGLARTRKLEEARKEYEKAVKIAPGFAPAWFELGLVHQMLNQTQDARKAYGEALHSDPRFVKAYRQMAVLSFNEQKWEEVVDATDRLLRLDPVSYPEAYFFNAFANLYLNRLDAAEQSAREVVKLDPDRLIPRARYVLGAVLIEKGDYAGAAEQLRKYIEIAEPGPDLERAKEMRARLETRLGHTPRAEAP